MFPEYSPLFNSGLWSPHTYNTRSKSRNDAAMQPITVDIDSSHVYLSAPPSHKLKPPRHRPKRRTSKLDLLSKFPDVPSFRPRPCLPPLNTSTTQPSSSPPALKSSALLSPNADTPHFVFPTPPPRRVAPRAIRRPHLRNGRRAIVAPNQKALLKRSLSSVSNAVFGHNRRSQNRGSPDVFDALVDMRRFSTGGFRA